MKYKNYTIQIGDILKDAEGKRAKIIAESEGAQNPNKYIAKNLEKVVEDTRQKLNQNSTDRMKAIIEQIGGARESLNNLSKWESGTGSEKQYYLMLANNITNAKNIEDGIKTYERIVAEMPNKDKTKYRKIIDFQLKELVNQQGPEYMSVAEKAIDNMRSIEEKNALKEINISNHLWEANKTLEPLITDQLQNLKLSEDLLHLDWSKVVEEMFENCRRMVENKPSVSEVQNQVNELVEDNPYFESDDTVVEK